MHLEEICNKIFTQCCPLKVRITPCNRMMARRQRVYKKFFDFKFLPLFGHHRTASDPILEAVLELGPDRFLSAHGVHPHLPVSALRGSLPGQSLRERFLWLGSI